MRRARPAIVLGLLLAASVASAAARRAGPAPAPALPSADPPWYVRGATWEETLRVSREALAREAGARPARAALPDFGRTPFTLLAWVRTEAGGTIFAKAPADGRWAPQGKTFFIRGGRLAYDIGWVGCVMGRLRVADGRWRHVAVARGEDLRLYVDGALDATGSLEFGPDGAGHVPRIGFTSANFPQTGGLRGDLDEVRLYGRCLTEAEVRAAFERPDAAPADGLLARWTFDADGSDSSGHGHDAVEMRGATLVEGRVGKAVRLDGGGVVALPGGGADPASAAWALVERDFPGADARREMAWEREDGLWQADRPAGDFAALAARYARAARRTPALAAEAAAAAARTTDAAGLAEVRALYLRSRRAADLAARAGDLNLGALRAAIVHLAETCGADYAEGRAFLARLDALERALADAAAGPGAADPAKVAADVAALRREALLARNPLLKTDRLLFVRRRTYQSNHYYTDYINGCKYYGGNLRILSLKDGAATDLVPSMKDGIFGRFDLSFDAARVVFDWKASDEEGFRLYEVGVDGRGLRQLTFPPPDEAQRVRRYRNPLATWQGYPLRYYHTTDDMQPCYLPGGGFAFISTRCEFGTLCDGPDVFTTTVLYRMDADGRRLEKLTNSSVSEASPSVMNDGRLLYTRWEYVDKGAVSVKCLWAMYPDGTRSAEVYGNTIALPPTLLHGRAIPGTSDRFVVLGTPHCPQSGVGTVIRLDMTRNIRTRDPMTYLTPDVDIRAEGGFHHRVGDKWVRHQNGPLFADPYPLSDAFVLVSHNPDKPWNDPAGWGLYLIDEFGNRVPVHAEEGTSCWQPVPVRPRPRPPVLASTSDADLAQRGLAAVAVHDVYRGLRGVERGTIKYIRINEQMPRPWAARRDWDGDLYDQQHAVITKDAHLGLKVQHGIVPVETDGSAHFTVPADRNIFLQVLDADFLEVQRERTYVNYRPGEMRSCVGCHELPSDAPAAEAAVPLALRRPPDAPGPQPGEASGARPLHYPADVQPVLDRHCVRCHGGDRPQADLDLGGEMTALFSRSYENLLARRLLPIIGENHPKTGNVEYLPPKSLGSHASRLVAAILKGCPGNDLPLPLADRVRLTTWVDSNGQYYGSYYGRRNLKYRGLPDFRPVPTFAEAVSLTAPVFGRASRPQDEAPAGHAAASRP